MTAKRSFVVRLFLWAFVVMAVVFVCLAAWALFAGSKFLATVFLLVTLLITFVINRLDRSADEPPNKEKKGKS